MMSLYDALVSCLCVFSCQDVFCLILIGLVDLEGLNLNVPGEG